MPIYVIERHHAEQMQLTDLGLQALHAQSLDGELRWLYSFLSADRRRSYCLYEAPSVETLRAVARQNGVPESAIVEVERVDSAMIEAERTT
jgi:hypothetical protein